MSTFLMTMPRASLLAVAVVMALFSPASQATSLADETARPTNEAPPTKDPVTLQTVRVRADVLDQIHQQQALTPGAVSVVDTTRFQERSVTNLSDAMRYVPGLWIDSASGSDSAFLSSRGSNLDATDYDGNGIKLLQDGLTVSAADGNNHNRLIDPLAAQQIIFARGANALSYGASTLGGAINFITPTALDDEAPLLAFSAGSHGLFSLRASAGVVHQDFDALMTLESKRWDGYRAHSKQRRVGLYANAGWQLGEAFKLRLFATHIENDQQLPGSLSMAQFQADPWQANPSAVSGNYQINVTTSRLAATGQWAIASDRQLDVGLSYEQQALYHPIVDKVMVDFDGAGPMPPQEVFSLLINTQQRTLAGSARYHIQIGDHDVLAGLNLADTRVYGQHFRNDGGQRNGATDRIDNHASNVEAFLLDRWQFAPDWTLVYGAQGVFTIRDVRTVHLANGSVRNPNGHYSSINPRLGVLRALGTSSQAFASISRIYEPPTTFELEDDARGGNALLDAMHGHVLEVGLRGHTQGGHAAPRWDWEMSAYYTRLHDEILSVDDPAAPGTSLSANLPRTTHAGIEALVEASLPFADGHHRIEPRLSVTFNQFHFDHDPTYGNHRLPAAPNYAIRGELLYRNDIGFFVGPTFDRVGSRYADFGNHYRVAGYSLIGLRAGLERDHWQVFLEARNLGDKRYISTLSVRDEAALGDAILNSGAPRSYYAGLRFRF